MTDDLHQRLASWFEEAARLEGAERDALLARCRREDPEVHGELCELLAHDTRGSRALEAGIDSGAVAAATVVAGARATVELATPELAIIQNLLNLLKY